MEIIKQYLIIIKLYILIFIFDLKIFIKTKLTSLRHNKFINFSFEIIAYLRNTTFVKKIIYYFLKIRAIYQIIRNTIVVMMLVNLIQFFIVVLIMNSFNVTNCILKITIFPNYSESSLEIIIIICVLTIMLANELYLIRYNILIKLPLMLIAGIISYNTIKHLHDLHLENIIFTLIWSL